MFDNNQLNQLKEKLKTAKSVLILLPSEPDTDSLSAALSLHLSLKGSDKSSRIGSSSPVKVGDSHLFGIDQVKDNIGSQNLVVSFDYKDDAVENVSYDIDEATNKFNLRIKPKSGAQPLDTSTISYSYTGATADLVFVLGVNSLEELGRLYSEEKEFLDAAQIVSLNLSATPSTFAAVSLHSAKPTSFSEAAAFILKSAGVNPTADAASNLYNQIIKTTDNFQSPKITADTFDLTAFLLRSGAQKSSPRPTASTTTPPQFFTPPSTTSQSETPPLPTEPPANQTKGVPADWQGPKIYRGSSLK